MLYRTFASRAAATPHHMAAPYVFRACSSRIEARRRPAQASRSSGAQRARYAVEGRALPAVRPSKPDAGDELPQRTGGVEPQMAHDLAARAAVDAAQADLGEDGLHPGEQQRAVVPGGQVRGGQHQMAARAQDPADLVERGVRVDEMLDHLAEQDGVGGAGPRTAARRR